MFPPSLQNQTFGQQGEHLKINTSNPFLRSARDVCESEETQPETKSMDGHAAMVGLTNTFSFADTTGWKHSYHALVTLKAVVNPSLVIPHPYLGFVEIRKRRRKKQSRPVKKA